MVRILNILFIVLCVMNTAMHPAHAETAVEQKQAMLADTRQQTAALGGDRFLMFSGSKAAYQYVYSIELISTAGGTPHYDPLFIEEYDPATGKVSLTNAVAFEAINYHFDIPSKTFHYTSIDAGDGPKLSYIYRFSGDTLKLEQVMAETKGNPPVTVFDAHAKKN